MLQTPQEIQQALGDRLRARRIALGWTQKVAAQRSGVAYRTWRRLENDGKASLEDVIKAAVALRCEGGFEMLFPQPAARTLDELLKRQIFDAKPPVPARVRRSSQS